MKSNELLKHIEPTKLVPVFYHDDETAAVQIMTACYEAGVRAFEFTNRGANASSVMQTLISEKPADLALGIGTIMDADACKTFIDLGVDFIVSPIVDQETAEICQQNSISWTPGTGTLTEIIQGIRLGAELIKIFPGNTLGPGFVKGVLGPCPNLTLMPTGGVSPDAQNLTDWFESGVFCVGMGSNLFTKEIIAFGKWQELTQRLKATISLIQKVSSK